MTATSAARLLENIADDLIAELEFGEALECTRRFAANFARRLKEIEADTDEPEAPAVDGHPAE